MESLQQEFMKVVEEAKVLLAENNEWRERYKGYVDQIINNLDLIEEVRKSFHQWGPLYVYLTTSEAKKATSKVNLDMRYCGQRVARITSDPGNIGLSTKGYKTQNKRDFGCDLELDNVGWRSAEATGFRSFFKNRQESGSKISKKRIEEHRLESLWLTELQKPSNKILTNIKAVEICKIRFPMPTPLSASSPAKLKYSGWYGGGIDILARVGTGGPNTYLCIIELKKDNEKANQPREALKQGIAYATFILELLRSESGSLWWGLFGFEGNIPQQLNLYVACMMPSSSFNDYSFEDMQLDVDGDILKLHYVYFDEENDELKSVDTSLKWDNK